ncbi:MAG: hypothetical protein PHQ23_08755, partial [Candidatus Wallbacteria bacterium]|nr:hypothetical protein [Candidatus Wallbacteria bacterium]
NSAWRYVLWGIKEHTNVSWAKDSSQLDTEIMISGRHCPSIYNCYYSKDASGNDGCYFCKRNSNIKKIKKAESHKICKPWFCSLIKKNEDWEKTFCDAPCYFASLWSYKQKVPQLSKDYPFLFDHPFPNSYYAETYNNIFSGHPEIVTLEAHVVRQADEIAQRKDDLEDALQKKMIEPEIVIEHINTLKNGLTNGSQLSDTEKADVADPLDKAIEVLRLPKLSKKSIAEVGLRLKESLTSLVISRAKSMFNKFTGTDELEESDKSISIYCLKNIKSICCKSDKKAFLMSLFDNENSDVSEIPCSSFFTIDTSKIYLYLLIYDFLETETHFGSYHFDFATSFFERIRNLPIGTDVQNIATKCKDLDELKQSFLPNTENQRSIYLTNLGITLNILKNFKNAEYLDYKLSRNRHYFWKNIDHLNLFQFYLLTAENMQPLDAHRKNYDESKEIVFRNWISTLAHIANRKISSIFEIKDIEPIKMFADDQCAVILKSEIVEKNDGKAGFILRKLFVAYLSNAHQLPDNVLEKLIHHLKDKSDYLSNSLQKISKVILDKLLSTTHDHKYPDETVISCFTSSDTLHKLKQHFNISPLASDTGQYDMLKLIKDIESNIKSKRFSTESFDFLSNSLALLSFVECIKASSNLHDRVKSIRKLIDNPVLNATPAWKNILMRTICDYIASMTDQEAIDEYDKLYAKTMEMA